MVSISVKLPAEVNRRVRQMAEEDGVTVQQPIARAVVEKLAFSHKRKPKTAKEFSVSRERLLELLSKAPDAAPIPGDEMPEDLSARLAKKIRGKNGR